MKFKKIVGFGDSWMYGDELLDPDLAASDPEAHSCWVQNVPYREKNCFLGLLGQHYQVPTENFGIPGGSLQSTIWTFLWWLKHEPCPEDCLILVCLTESDRESFYNPNHVHYSNDPPWNKFVHSTWVHFGSSVIGPEFTDLIKRYLVLTNCPELREYNFMQATMFFEGMAAKKNLNLLQFQTVPPPIDIKIDTMIFPDIKLTIFFRDHPENQNKELVMSGGHPNEKGHEIVRDMLITEIDRAILSK